MVAADGHNILQVVLPGPPGDPHRFANAAALLAKWQQEGVLVRDATPAFYLYHITHGVPGRRRTMRALVARVALDPSGQEILPHEHTLAGKRSDRLGLRQATHADCEPIWMLYRDAAGWVEELLESNAFEELMRFTDEAGHEHRLWRVDRREAVGEIRAQFDDRRLVIADGHHRYRTALEHAAATGRPEDASILTCLVRDSDPGLGLEATHRLIRDAAVGLADLRRVPGWKWEPVTDPLSRVALLSNRQILVCARDGAWLASFTDTKRSETLVQNLIVGRLHEGLLEPAGVTEPERQLGFTRDAAHALEEVASERAVLATLLPPETPTSVWDVARAGERMPQKSTYFVPKPRSGIVLGPLDEPLPTRFLPLDGDAGTPDKVLRP